MENEKNCYEVERDFKGVWIPKEIWFDERLTMLEKGILIEINSLDCGENGCYSSNKYIADFCKCSESAVSKAISKLTELGYLHVISFDGRTRKLKSRVVNFTRQSSKFYQAECENLPPININNNIDINNKENNIYHKDIYLKESKHKYGEYGRILLTDTEYQKLIADFGKDYIDKVIKRIDEYVEENNNKNKYKNFNLVIRKAIRDNWSCIKDIPKEPLNFDSEKFGDTF